MPAIDQILSWVNSHLLWGPPMLVLLVGTGVYLSFRLTFIQIRGLYKALYLAFIQRKEKLPGASGDISHFQALMTALSATVGTGNIAGVATAIAAGGPGALFWMWISGLFGMATKYSEAVLAVKYRKMDGFGQMSGGPMHYISQGLGLPFLGACFALFASIAAFGIGNLVQAHEVTKAFHDAFHLPRGLTAIGLSLATALVILGGIRSIGRVTSIIVPFMIIFYMGSSILILITHWRALPELFHLVIACAFSPYAAAGGMAGYGVKQAIRYGIARGVFSNESGLGSSPIAAAAAKTANPVNQALVSMTQTFIDTLVVCTMTGFVLILSGVWQNQGISGSEMTNRAFSLLLGGEIGAWIVTLSLIFFAYSTLLGWSYYGEKSVEYLLGEQAVKPYRIVFCGVVFLGGISQQVTLIWQLADSMNALMAFPNLIGLLGLAGIVGKETKCYYGGVHGEN